MQVVNSDKAPDKNFLFIDWLRGLAALVVVFFHYYLHVIVGYPTNPVPPNSFASHVVFGTMDLGKFGVGVFFIVSGFLIPASLRGSSASAMKFFIHRVFRLYPAYWLSLVIYVAVQLIVAGSFDWSLVAINATMLHRFVGVQDAVGAYWTLQIEVIFYLFCTLIFFLGLISRQTLVIALMLCAAVIAAGIKYKTGKSIPVAVFIALALMFMGDQLRAVAAGTAALKKAAYTVVVVALALVPVCLLSYGDAGSSYVLSYWLAIFCFVMAFCFRAGIEKLGRVNLIGHWLANCSYGAYLIHGSIGLTVGAWIFGQTRSAVATAVAMFGVTYLLAIFSYLVVEKPMIRAGHRLARAHASGRERHDLDVVQ